MAQFGSADSALRMLYNLAQGPLVWVAFILFVAGSVYQVTRLLALTRKTEAHRWGRTPDGGPLSGTRPADGLSRRWTARLRLSIAGTQPLTIGVTVIFHTLLFLVPLFLLAHNILVDEAWGFSLFAVREKLSDYLTLLFLACALFFLLRRMLLARVRALSSFQDYYILFLAAAPFASGFLAYHQIFDYRMVITLHMLLGELMLASIPFTKIAHMFLFFVLRYLVAHEYSLGSGRRVWR